MAHHLRFTPLLLLLLTTTATAHPTIENALKITIHPQKISIEARISMEEILMVERDESAPPQRWQTLTQAHAPYLLKHLHLQSDGQPLTGKTLSATAPDASGTTPASLKMATYLLEYPLPSPPVQLSLRQDFLREYSNWSASFIVQIKQIDDAQFDLSMLTRENRFVYDCQWKPFATATTQPHSTESTRLNLPATFFAYARHGIEHIIGPFSLHRWDWRQAGFDHLLFAAALVLGTRKWWDLLKIITAFTLAHTLTLTLSVLNWLTLSPHLVEPMIAASIIFVALQNALWPRQTTGPLRLAIAFGFGLFHGLGFAGGLKEAMTALPPSTLATALLAFSLGVEIGHQIVVLPLFAALPHRATANTTPFRRYASTAVALCGAWYLLIALRIFPV